MLKRSATFSLSKTLLFITAAGFMCGLSSRANAENLAEKKAFISSPQLSAAGSTACVSWIETSEGSGDVLKYTVVSDETPLDQLSSNTHTAYVSPPSATIHEATSTVIPGTSSPVVAWISSDQENSSYRLMVQTPGSPNVLIHESESLIELPGIDISTSGTAYLVWTEVKGGTSRTWVADRDLNDPEAIWEKGALTATERPYDILPQVFAAESHADIYWYSISDSDVIVYRAVLEDEVKTIDTLDFGDMPTNRLPMLYPVGSEGMLGAVWIEVTEEGESYISFDPRQDLDGQISQLGSGEATVRQPYVSGDGYGLKCWLEEVNEGTTLSADSINGDTFGVTVSSESTSPQVAGTQSFTHLIWIEEDSEFATATLKYQRR